MIYRNNDPAALLAMEAHRLGNYGEDDFCSSYDNDYWDEMSDSLYEEERDERS